MRFERLKNAKPIHRYLPSWEIILVGILSVLAVHLFRAEFHRWLPALWIETLWIVALPAIIMGLIGKYTDELENETPKPMMIYLLQAGSIAMGIQVIVIQVIMRSAGMGDANEVIALTCLQAAAWYLAVFSAFGNFGKLSFILSSFIVLFICFMSSNPSIFAVAFLFAILSLWWLLGNYWTRLADKAIDAESTTLPVNGLVIAVSLLILVAVGTVASQWAGDSRILSSRGFLPFSGGEQGYADDLARAGIGDGNMLTAGNNATTTGAVDSDQFIEDDKPSMYDVMNEKYEGPVFKKPRHRAVALDVVAKHMHNVKQSEQSGRTFRTIRESKEKAADLDLESRITKALFFLEGSVPARFATDCFHHFDGWDWSKSELAAEDHFNPKILLKNQGQKPWYEIPQPPRSYITTRRAHRVKMMRLKTNSLPSPTFLKSWHIHRVDKSNMFRWSESGLVRMDGEQIPTHTIIDQISGVPNYHLLRSSKNLRQSHDSNWFCDLVDFRIGAKKNSVSTAAMPGPFESNPDSPFLQIPDNGTRATLIAEAAEWTDGIRPGWNQVEAIIESLREEFRYDPALVAPNDVEDSVGHFLEQGGGPSYMFATTAVQLLRAAGYKTRLTSGFLVTQKDYIRTSRQSVVDTENFHMWPEVCLDGRNWIALEPTPGYPIPYSTQTIGQWLKRQLSETWFWLLRHPGTCSIVILFVVAAVCYRIRLFSMICSSFWFAIFCVVPGWRLAATRKLIDLRFWAAGMPRPEFATVGEWYQQVDAANSTEFLSHWYVNNYCIDNRPKTDLAAISRSCKRIAGQLTIGRIKKSLRTSPTSKES